jgi:predicted nuclease of predicted toxin-antitoxin system
VALNLYLDDCSNSNLLADLLQQAGHRVVCPTEAGVELEGQNDQADFQYAIANGLTIITKNPADFQTLHELEPHHFGILAVYQDNDPARDMSAADMVKAIRNFEEAGEHGGPAIHGEFHTLKEWRF